MDNILIKLRNQKGAAFAIAIIFVAMLFSLSAILLSLSINNNELKTANRGKIERYYESKSGVETAFAVVNEQMYEKIVIARTDVEDLTTAYIDSLGSITESAIDINKIRQYYFIEEMRSEIYSGANYYIEQEIGSIINVPSNPEQCTIDIDPGERQLFSAMPTIASYTGGFHDVSATNNEEYIIVFEVKDIKNQGSIKAEISIKIPLYYDFKETIDINKKFTKLTYLSSTY